ncbi:MAG: hypothetical protein ACRDWY_14190 [Actinomycetes bacterium]
MNSTLTAALAGERIAALHRDAYHRRLAREIRAARPATPAHRPGRRLAGLLPARWRQAAA